MPNKDEKPFLFPLLTDPSSLKKEFNKRNKHFHFTSVSPRSVPDYESDGWLLDKKLKKRVRMKKPKLHDERLEDLFWCFLYRMGFENMNQGRQFKIRYKRKMASDGEKQIDIFAKEEETVIVAECKSSSDLKKRNLQKDLEEFAHIRKGIANSVRKFYGPDYKPKFLWLFVTKNIIWSDADKERAKAGNIQVITEAQLPYFVQIANYLGPATKYQFLAEFFAGKSIPGLSNKKIPAIKGKLGGKKFFCFVTTPKQLLKISFVNHRALDDPLGIPTYNRLVEKGRINKIGRFIESGGFFPTNVLVNFNAKVRFDISMKDDEADIHFGYLYLPDKYKSAWIIDGQHRLYGYSKLDDKYLKQNITVLAFENLPRTEEANLFITINHEQKSVPRSLLDDLEGDLKWGSDKPSERIGSIGARIVKIINSDIGSPFYNRVRTGGISATDETCLTIPEIKSAIRRSGLIGKAILKTKLYEAGAFCGTDDIETTRRACEGLNLYFSSISEANLKRWELGRGGFVCFNPGISGHIRLLSEIINFLEKKHSFQAINLDVKTLIGSVLKELAPILKYITVTPDNQFEDSFRVPYGSRGPREYFFRLCTILKENGSDFEPDDYVEWEKTKNEEMSANADRQVKELNSFIVSYVFEVFKQKWPDGNDYWENGVANKDMMTNAYKKSLEDEPDQRAPIEEYLDLLDIKKIVEKSSNWPMFKSVLDIPEPGVKGKSKNTKWLERLNKIRRIPAHKTENREYDPGDFEFLDWLEEEFMSRLDKATSQENSEA
ncbi:MAG: DGQHR domain-containing protein [Deltaproteobacteria bacterium]|nr:DGQHR domain-containing protein [Deltaproteobacteria bacterium]